MSLSARRAWIEIMMASDVMNTGVVALRKESVDRNFCSDWARALFRYVALRKESVDRNTENAVLFLMTSGSLSARRAWIEIIRTSIS